METEQPAAKKKDPLTARLAFRLPSDVADDWRAKAAASGMSLSDFLRSAVDSHQLTGCPTPRKARKPSAKTADPALVMQLAKAGNNLNQLARILNTHFSSVDRIELLIALNSIRQQLAELAELADHAH